MKLFFLLYLFMSANVTLHALPKLAGSFINKTEHVNWNWSDAKLATAVVFLSTKCPCSHSHIPVLKSLVEKFPEVKWFGIHSNVDENLPETESYFKELKPNFDVIQDPQANLANIFKAYKTPHAYLISKEGAILYVGGVTSSALAQSAEEQYLENAITELKLGKEISKKSTRVLGCTIARK